MCIRCPSSRHHAPGTALSCARSEEAAAAGGGVGGMGGSGSSSRCSGGSGGGGGDSCSGGGGGEGNSFYQEGTKGIEIPLHVSGRRVRKKETAFIKKAHDRRNTRQEEKNLTPVTVLRV